MSKRALVLLAILLGLGGYFAGQSPQWSVWLRAYRNGEKLAAPVAGTNAISDVVVARDDRGRWIFSVDYFYTGLPEGATLVVGVSKDGQPEVEDQVGISFQTPLPGANRLNGEILRPDSPADAFVSVRVHVVMRGPDSVVLARKDLDQTIQWPTFGIWHNERNFASLSSEELLKRAIAMIDESTSDFLPMARSYLERVLKRDGNAVQAYVELARVAMKSNWGPEGLRQAEGLLASALQIDPAHHNAKILLGYVYTHQRRYAQAEALFAEVAPSETRNTWLWVNWGELLSMQGKTDAAAAKYAEALARPRTYGAYDRARLEAYSRFVKLKQRANDATAVDAAYKQFSGDFGPGHCFNEHYAWYLLGDRGEPERALQVARAAVDLGCGSTGAREALGIAYYASWAAADEKNRSQFLNQARVFLPGGPRVMYLLAGSERTVHVAKQLVAAGEPIDQRDNGNLTALAYALRSGDLSRARRLLRLGARADTPIGMDEMPVAFIPVVQRDLAGVRLLRHSGVDYTRLRFRGMTALEYAHQTNDRQLIEALGLSTKAT